MAIRINRRLYTWHDLEFSLIIGNAARQLLIEIADISWDHSIEKVNVYGAGRSPIGQARGAYQPQEGTMSIYKPSWEELKNTLGAGYLDADFSLSIKYATSTEDTQETTIEGSLLGEAESLALSADAILVPVRYMPTLIQTNGLQPYADSF